MPIFNFNKRKSPAELVEEGISFARDLFGEHNLYFKQEEYVPPPTSHAPPGMRLVTVSGSKEAAESGDYFKFLIGFHGENPYIYEKETYQQTTPGFLPVNEPAKETRFKYYPFTPGKNPSVVLNPIQHIFALAAGTVLGRPARVNDIRELSEKNLEGRWRQVKEGAVEISSYEGRPVVIGGLPYAIKLGESSAKELADLMAGGPVIGLQNVRKDVFNAEGMAEERTRIDASAGRIPGLPREVYGLDTISKTHRLLRSVSVGFQNEDDTISSLTNTPTKAAQIGKRPYNPAMIFTRNKAYDVPESGNYRLQTAVMERGDPVGKQLVMNTLVPTVGGEGSRASGSSHFQAPTELLKTVRGFGPRAALEATFRSTIDLPIEGLSGPEDLFYTTKGERKLRIALNPKFTPEGLAKKNVLRSASTFRVAEIIGMQGEHPEKRALVGTTRQRHAAVEGAIFTMPIEWLDDPTQKKFIESTLIPALQEQGFSQIEYRATEAEKGRRPVSVGLNIRQGEPMALKNFMKVTNTPVSRNVMGLWRKTNTGNLVVESTADAIVPFKLPEGVVWSRFNVASREEQREMLYSIAGENLAIRESVDKYYNSLKEGEPAVLRDIATAVGEKGPIPLLERMTGSILGRERVLHYVNEQGVPVIDERVLAQQNAAYAKYGIGRDYGYTPIGEFTGETKQQFIEGAVRNLIKYSPNKMTAAEAQKIVESAYVFTPGKKLSDDTEIFQGFEMQEVIRARGVAYNPITEVSGVAGEKNDEIAEIMIATGNADIVKFKNMTRREMSGTQAALNDLAAARSATLKQRGRAGAYIHVGDEETNPERYTMNRQDLLSIVEQLSINNPSSTDLLEGLRKELSNKFGDEFGLEIENAGQKVYLPKVESIQRLDASTEELIAGEESEIRNESLSRLPQRYVGIAQAMAGGSDVDVENAINSFIYTSDTYIRSANLDKTPFGIYSPYETNTLLKPGQLFLSREAQERYYKIMGGDEFNTSEFRKYLGLFTGGAVGVGGRQPYISQKPGDAYGSVAPFEIITEDDPIGKRIAEQQRATGIRSMDLVLSPAQVGMLGDSDADKLSLYVAIGRAQGDQGEFINMLGPMSPEERKAYLQDLLQKQRPEVGEKAMEIMMGGEGPLALEKNPTLANQIGYLLELSGKTEPAGLWSKRPYHNIEDIWEGAVGKASGQKSHAMGDTHNQLKRRLHASGMALKLEPGAYLEAMTSIGTKHSELAVDQAYESQALVKMLKGAFIGRSTKKGSAQIVFDKSSSLTGDAEFINLAWNKISNYDTLIGRIGSILMESDDLSDTAISRLLGTVSGTTGKRLTEKQSQQLAKRQLRNWQQLEPEIMAMRKMGTGARAQRMNELVRQGKVGGNSLLGVALKTRLAEQYEGKLASENDERMASAEEIRSIAAASGLDINEELLNPTISASRDIYDILKTDKYTDIGYWKDPGNFAATAMNWANLGMENYPVIQEQMRIWGGIHNLSFQPKEGGGVQVVSGDTGKVINSSESLSEYQAALINKPRPVDTNYVDTSTFEIPGEMQEAKNLAEAKAIRNSFEKTEKDKPTWYLADLLNIPHSPPPSPPPPIPPSSPPSSPPPPPPNEPPSDTGETEMPRDRDPGINGSAFYVQEKTPSYAQVEHRARRFSSTFQSFMREGGGYDALTRFGTGERFSNLFGISSDRGTVIERYSDLMARGDQYARTMVPFYLRNNPQTSRALSQLREMKRQAPYLYEMTGNATLEGRLAGALIGKSESTRLLFEEEGGIGKQLIGMMGFLDEPMPRERPHDLPIDSALYLAENRALLRASYAEQENIRINSPYTKSQVALTEADLLKAREARAFNELEEIEIANEIPEEERVTSAYKRLGAGQITEKELAEEVDKRKTSLSKTVGLSDKNLIPKIGKLEAAHDAAAKAQAEYESFGGVSSRVKFESRGIELAELTKLSQAFHDITNGTDSYIKTLNKSTEEMDKFRESVKSGTEEQKKQLEIAEKSRELSKGAIRELIKKAGGADIVSDTEMLTDAEIDYASLNLGKPGQELLEEYKTSRATSSVLEKEIREQGAFPAWTKQLGRAARNIFSGFGLMYMRSMVGMIGGASETGYEESVQYEAALNKAMSTQWGAQKGYNPEADLAGYKALMGGGGKRLINQVIASIYENEPGLIEAGKGIFAGIAGGSSSLWFLNQVAPNFAAAGPVAIAAGATIGIGSYLLNQFGKVTDQTSWLASSGANYLDFERARLNPPSRNPQFTTPSNTIWENLGLMTQSSGRYLAEAYDIAPEWRKEFDENVRLARLQGAAQELVDKSNNTMDLSQAMKKLGYSEEDQFAINKAKALEITAKMMKSVSTEGRVAAAQQLQYFGINPSDNKIDLMNLVGKAYDSGIDYASITEGLLQATGNKYEEDRGRVFEAVASADYTGEEVSRMTSLLEFTTTLGPKWNRQFYGKDISDLVETVTPGGAGVSSIFQKAEQLEKIKYAGQKTEEPLAELFGEFTPEGEKVSSLLEKAEKLYGPVFGENQDLVRQYLATQAEAGLYGIKYEGREIGELPPELLREMTPEEREGRVLADTRYNIGRSAIASWAQKSGRSAIGLQNFWSQLTQTGTLAQQEQYLNVLSNPTPLNFGILVSQLSAEGQAAWNQGTLNVAGVEIPQSALSLTGVNQLTGKVSGRPWGQASLAAPGISAQAMAAKIWGSNWASSAGAAQPAIDAMVNGFTVGDKTYYGEQGLQAWQNQFSYNQAMAQVGVQLKQIALSEAFTTGKGLSAYGFEEGAGFWSIEDRERELSRRQQEASFENQAWNIRQSEKRLALSEKYYGQNLALTQTQRTMQRAWTQQDWAYQENIRDLQWGWKQEDFQENIRFMTGRERRLAERQMKRDTIMYDLEGERIDDQKERQQSLWKLEDQRFDLDKKQHQETLKMQLEEIAHDKKIFEQSKRFYEEEKKLQDESVRLQRAYYIEQQKLQRESAGIAASAAITQKAVNDAMLDYNDYIQEQKGYLDLAATSFETLQTAIENLIKAIEEGGFNQPTTFTPTQHPGSTNGSQILTIDINGREIARYMLQELR